MSEESSAGHGPESVFDRVKARHLLGWLALAAPLAIVVLLMDDSELVLTCVLLAYVYGVPFLWWRVRARKKGLALRGFVGCMPAGSGWVRHVFLNVPVFLLSLGSILAVYGVLARYAPQFVESLLSKPQAAQDFLSAHPALGTALELLGSLVIAPLFEEFMFRGFLLHRLARKWGLGRAIVVVSVLFGFLHINFIGAGVFSLVLCVVYLRTGSIWPPVLLHFVNNLISSWPTGGGDGKLAAADLQSALWVGLAMALAAAAPIAWFLKRNWPGEGTMLPYERQSAAAE